MRKSVSILAVGAVIAAMTGLGGTARARHSSPGGEFNLQVGGFELITDSSVSSRVDLKGRGTILSDPTGALTSGALTISAVNGAIPEAAPVASMCTGTATGQISKGGNDIYKISFDYTDGANSGQCLSQTLSLTCTRAVFPTGLASDLAAGSYNCVVSAVSGVSASNETVDASSVAVHFGSHAAVQ
ncbi:MAG TPA: hypothetical protein VMV27_08020 [Candidatus Binataceae bacterium]|nr:hypothetical protein [Candidatus Binataceae bacterium]